MILSVLIGAIGTGLLTTLDLDTGTTRWAATWYSLVSALALAFNYLTQLYK